MFGEIFIIPLVLRTRGIINISPNTRAIFHEYFSNRVISYTYLAVVTIIRLFFVVKLLCGSTTQYRACLRVIYIPTLQLLR